MQQQNLAAADRRGRMFLGRGAVRLSDLLEKGNPHPDPFHDWCPLCIKKQRQLEGTLRLSKEVLQTALTEHVLRANVSKASWAAKELLEVIPLIGDTTYECWQVRQTWITKGIPFLNYLRSVPERKRDFIYAPHRPWVLVEFYEEGNVSKSPTAEYANYLYLLAGWANAMSDETLPRSAHSGETKLPRSAHGEMRRIFETTRGHDVATCRLLATHVKEAILVGKTSSLRAPMTRLLKHPVMWLAPSLGYWSGLRKSLFREECANYIHYIAERAKQLTLGEDDAVIAAVQHPSVKKLESRNPYSSENDLSFVVEQFRSKHFLPDMSNLSRRREVEKAICAFPGPFLTFETLAHDLRVLMRMQVRLKPCLKEKPKGESLRTYLVQYFQERFKELHCEWPDATYCGTEDQFANKCYVTLFLHLLRTASEETHVETHDLGLMAVRVFKGEESEDKDKILIVSPPYSRSSIQSTKDVPIESRHGMELFQHTEAALYLYGDQLQASRLGSKFVAPADLARDIACIFLYGTPVPASACLLRDCSRVVVSKPSGDFVASSTGPVISITHNDAAPNSEITSVSAVDTGQTLSPSSDFTIVTCHNYQEARKPSQAPLTRSQCASIIDASRSAVSGFSEIATPVSRKRRRSSMFSPTDRRPRTNQSLRSRQRSHRMSANSAAQSIFIGSSSSLGSDAFDDDETEINGSSAHSLLPVPSSLYSVALTPHTATPKQSPNTYETSQEAKEFLLYRGNPFQPADVEHAAARRTDILFRATNTENLTIRVPLRDHYIGVFYRSQMKLDEDSMFWHRVEEERFEYQSYQDLMEAIDKYELCEMFVLSDKLGSIDDVDSGSLDE